MKCKLTSLMIVLGLVMILPFSSCKKDKTASGPGQPSINPPAAGSALAFGTVVVGLTSTKSVQAKATNLTADLTIAASDGYTLSIDNTTFSSSVSLTSSEANTGKTLHIRFSPVSNGPKDGTVTFASAGADDVTLAVTGAGGIQQTHTTFTSERLAFGSGLSQSAQHEYTLPADLSYVNKINMYVKLRCPSGNCGDWDVYAHIQVKDQATGNWFELGRYITPYGVDNHQVGRGFEIDVTDFKSLLQGTVTLRAFIEVWTADGWLLSVDFDYLSGTPDYPYYAVSKVLQYNQHSLAGVIYGEDASAFDLTKTISIPSNAATTNFRTIISGWGHATPNDANGRPCAEWCFRTHNIKINGTNTFSHNMGPIGCPNNPVQPQGGNWEPDRAGWCPGMAVPVRQDQLATNMAGQSFNFEYSFQPWVNDLMSTNSNPHAYNAISTYVVVKSNSPITSPVVID